ncbi:hypothetical protein AABB24_018170, partial [Solanum stoloniferum]
PPPSASIPTHPRPAPCHHPRPVPRRHPRPQPPTIAAVEDAAAAAEEVTPSSRRSRASIPTGAASILTGAASIPTGAASISTSTSIPDLLSEEKEFQVEVEAIGHVRHKNLVSLLGYCIEGMHREIDSPIPFLGTKYEALDCSITFMRI